MPQPKSPSFQFYPRDFIHGTWGFTAEQRGAYIALLCWQWDKGHVPDDPEECARIAGCDGNALASIWHKFGICQGDAGAQVRKNPRLEVIRAEQDAYREKQREIANRRWGKGKKDGSGLPPHSQGNADPLPTDCEGNATAMPSHPSGIHLAHATGMLCSLRQQTAEVPPIVPQGGQGENDSPHRAAAAPPEKKEKGAAPPSPAPAGKSPARQARLQAIDLAHEMGLKIVALFQRRSDPSSAMLAHLKDHAERGILPLPADRWQAIGIMHAARVACIGQPEDFALRVSWLKSAEHLAARLPEAGDCALAWVRDHGGVPAGEKKTGAPENWRELAAGQFPGITIPREWKELPEHVRTALRNSAVPAPAPKGAAA